MPILILLSTALPGSGSGAVCTHGVGCDKEEKEKNAIEEEMEHKQCMSHIQGVNSCIIDPKYYH